MWNKETVKLGNETIKIYTANINGVMFSIEPSSYTKGYTVHMNGKRKGTFSKLADAKAHANDLAVSATN